MNLMREQSYLSHQTHSTTIECLHKEEMGFVSALYANVAPKRFTWQWQKSYVDLLKSHLKTVNLLSTLFSVDSSCNSSCGM